jgi:TolB-like protein
MSQSHSSLVQGQERSSLHPSIDSYGEHPSEPVRTYLFRSFELDLRQSELRSGGRAIQVRSTPLRLLTYLIRNRDRVVSKNEILDHVWAGTAVSEGALTSALREVRRAVRDDGVRQGIVRTERGRGFRFVAPVEELVPGTHPPENTVAVLPFLDLGPDRSHEQFADGVVEEITHCLSQFEKLQVASRTSAFAYKDRPGDVRTIAKELGVAHIVEGSVRGSGDEIRITAQLIRAEDGYHLWSECYDGSLARPLALQRETALDVAARAAERIVSSSR